MEESGQNRGIFEYHISEDTLPQLLETKIDTCVQSYRRDNPRLPNAIILSKEARAALSNVELLETSSFISGLHERDAVVGKDFRLDVYNVNELSKAKKLDAEKMFLKNPGSLYLARTGWLGKIKEKSLEWYNFEAPGGDLAQT